MCKEVRSESRVGLVGRPPNQPGKTEKHKHPGWFILIYSKVHEKIKTVVKWGGPVIHAFWAVDIICL